MRRVRGKGATSRTVDPADADRRPKRRRRKKVGKSSNEAYKATLAYVLEDVHETVMAALRERDVKREMIVELDEWGVQHRSGKAEYSDLVELLLRRWMDEKGIESGG